MLLQSIMALAAVNLWTGSPLVSLWVGSRAVTEGRISMLAVGVVAATMLALSLALIWVLGAAATTYDTITGRPATVRRHVPWLRSMRGERKAYERGDLALTPLERSLVVSVVIAVLCFEVWFFLYSGSPLDQRTGRG